MKTLLTLGTLIQQPTISFEGQLPSFGDAFVSEKATSLEQVLGMEWQKKQKTTDLLLAVDQYEYTLVKKENYELFLFGRAADPYSSFEQYATAGIALRLEF